MTLISDVQLDFFGTIPKKRIIIAPPQKRAPHSCRICLKMAPNTWKKFHPQSNGSWRLVWASRSTVATHRTSLPSLPRMDPTPRCWDEIKETTIPAACGKDLIMLSLPKPTASQKNVLQFPISFFLSLTMSKAGSRLCGPL